jgi:hypothetical protein
MAALYMQSLMDSANSFSTTKIASAFLVFLLKINVFTNLPTMAPEVCMVRRSAARKFGLSAKRVKDSFLWFQLVDFALLHAIHHQGYCNLGVSQYGIFSFGAMCRYSDAIRLTWINVRFESDSSSLENLFERRNNLNSVKETKL